MMDSFRRLILLDFFRIGVNGRRRFACRSVTTLRVSFRPFEDLRVRQAHPTSKYPEEDRGAMSAPFESLRAVSLSNRSNWFMAQTALKPHLILDDDNSLD